MISLKKFKEYYRSRIIHNPYVHYKMSLEIKELLYTMEEMLSRVKVCKFYISIHQYTYYLIIPITVLFENPKVPFKRTRTKNINMPLTSQ